MDAWSGVMYMDAWPLNQTVEGLAGVGVVIKNTSSAYKQGDIVEAAFGWPWKLYFSANKCEPSLRLSLKKVMYTIFPCYIKSRTASNIIF